MSESDITAFTANWNRAIFIDDVIDDDLVRELGPTILRLRQESNDPITVGINSPGGSLDSLDILLGLLTGPTLSGARGKIITVVTNNAYSAAANFLAFGDYSIALRHAKILYHDVRYSGMDDVTPAKALMAAKSLKDANDNFSLRLADKIVGRLVWIYMDLSPKFEETNKKYPRTHKRYEESLSSYGKVDGGFNFDMASFATCLFAKLSRENDQLIDKVMNRLSQWIALTTLATGMPSYREKGSRRSGLLDGVKVLHQLFNGEQEDFKSSEADLKLLLTLLMGEMAQKSSSNRSFQGSLEEATRNFVLMQSMNDEKHGKAAMRLMLQNSVLFRGEMSKEEFDGKTRQEKEAIFTKAIPTAQLFWLFCALLCRELFEGEHILKPNDAQLLGLVNEVAGGGEVESPREYSVRTNEEVQEPVSQ